MLPIYILVLLSKNNKKHEIFLHLVQSFLKLHALLWFNQVISLTKTFRVL